MLFKRTPSISAANLEKIMADQPQLIDVREPQEFRGGHIPGANNIPLSRVENYTPRGKVYVICQTGLRSKKAAKILMKNGVDVVNVRGGMMAWKGSVRGGKM